MPARAAESQDSKPQVRKSAVSPELTNQFVISGGEKSMKQDETRAVPVFRDPPDVKALARALTQMAIEQERKRLAKQAKIQRPRADTSPKPSDLVK